MPQILKRVETNFSHCTNKYYHRTNADGVTEPYFDALHTCQYFIFLYYVANTIYKNDKSPAARELCDKVYGLSKVILGADIYYEVEMPDVWTCDHPHGSVIGRAKIGEGFCFAQEANVGNNRGVYPVLGNNVKMHPGSKVHGNCRIGNNVWLSTNAYVKDQDVPDNVIVFGMSPNLVFKKRKDLPTE